MKVRKQQATTGRPREFDIDNALDSALLVFWEKGYEGASLTDLTEAMGINRPSLYATFGDKESLFIKVLDRYCDGPGAYFQEALKEPTARSVVERLMNEAVDRLTDPSTPKGCLIVQGTQGCGSKADPIREVLASRRVFMETAIRDRLKIAKSEGDLPSDSNPTDLARYIVTIINGIVVLVSNGASKPELKRVVKIALRALPL